MLKRPDLAGRAAISPSMRTKVLNTAMSLILGAAVIVNGFLYAPRQAHAQPAPPYHIVKRLVLTGFATAFSVDEVGRRLFGADSDVVDIDKDSVVGFLPTGSGYVAVAATNIRRGLTRTGVIFDLATLNKVSSVDAVGRDVVYDPTSRNGFILTSDTVKVVDIQSSTVLARLSLRHGLPGNARSAVVDNQGHLFVNVITFPSKELGEQSHSGVDSTWRPAHLEIVVIDTRTATIANRWDLPNCFGVPTGMSIDLRNRRLFVNCASQLLVVDASTGRLVTSVPMVGFSLYNAFDSVLHVVLNPTRDGRMTVVRQLTPDTYETIGTMFTAEGSTVVGVDSRTHRVFLRSMDAPLRVLILEPSVAISSTSSLPTR